MSAPLTASSELAAKIELERAAQPWLFSENARTERLAMSAPIGVPMAVKIGVAIGQARRRDQLAQAIGHGEAAYAGGLIGDDVRKAINVAAANKSEWLARQRAWWARVAPPRVLNRVDEKSRRPRIEHRAKLAASGPMPPDLAKKFSVGQLAVLKIIADEVARRGTCGLSKKEISDRARASESTVHDAIRKAVWLDMLSVKQRPVPGRKNLPNLIMVTDSDWRLWIMRPKYRAVREDKHQAQQNQGANPRPPQSVCIYKKGADGVWSYSEKKADRDGEAWIPVPYTRMRC